MAELFLPRPGWTCTSLPANGAIVQKLKGVSPAEPLAVPGEDGCLEALFCLRGEVLAQLPDGRRLTVCAGQAVLFPDGTERLCCRLTGGAFMGILVREDKCVALTSLSALFPDLKRAVPEEGCGWAVIEIALWCEALFAALDCLPTERQGVYCAGKAMELFYLCGAGKIAAPHRRDGYHDRYQTQTVQKIHDYMLEHLDQRLTISALSEQFHISQTHLKTCFRQLYGAPIHRYVLERRMARAAQLLCATDQTVLQVAMAVGYGSVGQFGAAFKSRYQMPPSQFRRQARKMSVVVCSGLKQDETSGEKTV